MSSPFWTAHAALITPAVSVEQDRIEWLKVRRTGLGSSDASAVLNMNKRSSAWLLWQDKTGRVALDSVDTNEAMEWGNILEPAIRDVTARRLGVTISKPSMMRSIERPWQLCDPDGVIESERAVFEAKNTSAWLASEWDGDTAEVPDHAELQVNHAMAVTGAECAYVSGLIGGNRMVTARIERNDDLIAMLVAAEAGFWHEHVLADVEPPIDGSDAAYAMLRDHGFNGEATVAEDPDEAREWAQRYQSSSQAEKAAKDAKSEARNRLMRMHDGAQLLVDDRGDVISKITRGVFAPKRFEEDHPDIAAVTRKKIDVLDIVALKLEHPELYQQYQAVFPRIPTNKKGK